MSSESEKTYDEDEELEQLINGEVCFKVYPFSKGIVFWLFSLGYTVQKIVTHPFSADSHASDAERKIILPGSFNPLHDGHLKLLEVASRYI